VLDGIRKKPMLDHVTPRIRNVARILSSQDAPLQVRLVEAGNELWAAMSYPGEWPADLRGKATRIVNRLLEGGSVQTTVAQMQAPLAAVGFLSGTAVWLIGGIFFGPLVVSSSAPRSW
jgi:hypothetical protein